MDELPRVPERYADSVNHCTQRARSKNYFFNSELVGLLTYTSTRRGRDPRLQFAPFGRFGDLHGMGAKLAARELDIEFDLKRAWVRTMGPTLKKKGGEQPWQ